MTLNYGSVEPYEYESLAGPTPWQPEDHDVFRLAQLTLLLSVASRLEKPIATVDRLGYYDFFSANPFVVVSKGSKRDDEDRLSLKLAGFVEDQLSYASTGQRWVSRRRRLQHDMALLLSYGLITLHTGSFQLTVPGVELAERMSTVYADAYRVSAELVIRRLSKLSDRALQQSVQSWLGSTWLSLDLLDDVTPESVSVEEDVQ
jgi:hypothetical protein